mgnify:CR=1 FL=1
MEITEGMLMTGAQAVDEALAHLNELGVRIAMDDFGTGYSSMSNLRRYPFDALKIDKSFTNDVEATSLVQLIIDSGHLLGASVTAEGIDAIEVSAKTGFPEIMDGRVKTLHPAAVHKFALAFLLPFEFLRLKNHE